MTKNKIILTGFLLLTTFLVQASTLPDLGSPDLVEYDHQTETALGRAFNTELHTHYKLISDPETLAYIRRIGQKIVSQTGSARSFKFYVLDNPEINAFAGPNGVIGIHSGLILAAENEDELASVMAHEIAHVTQHHLSRSFDYQKSLNVGNIASLIAAILIGSQNPSAGIATFMGGMGATLQQQLKNSRIHEHEADYIGIQYLDKAGYNPHAMATFFGKLLKSAQLNEYHPPEILLTHPVTTTRLAQAEDRARQFPPFKVKPKEFSLDLIKQRLLYKSKTPQNAYQILQLSKASQCYQRALQQLNTSQAPKCLTQMKQNHPNNQILKLIETQFLNKTHPALANKQFKYLLAIYPRDASILIRYAKALASQHKYLQAEKVLTQNIPHHPYQYHLYLTLAELYAHQKKEGLAYYYDAMAQHNIGNDQYTIHLLKKALPKIAKQNEQLKLKIKQQIKALKNQVKKDL